MVIETQRRGGKYEAAGFLIMLPGVVMFCAGLPVAAVPFLILGFAVFIVGRFM